MAFATAAVATAPTRLVAIAAGREAAGGGSARLVLEVLAVLRRHGVRFILRLFAVVLVLAASFPLAIRILVKRPRLCKVLLNCDLHGGLVIVALVADNVLHNAPVD
jgi:hypothetical protein